MTTRIDLEEARRICDAATEGPWRFEVNLKSKHVNLCGGDPRAGFGSYDLTVIDFVRWGMAEAAPRFRDNDTCVMHRIDELTKEAPGREHHQDWFRLVYHPDAQFVEYARTALPDALDEIERLRAEKLEPFTDAVLAIGEQAEKFDLTLERLEELQAAERERDDLRAEVARLTGLLSEANAERFLDKMGDATKIWR